MANESPTERKYPLLDREAFKNDFWSMLSDYGSYLITDYACNQLNNYIERKQSDSKFLNETARYLETQRKRHNQQYHTKFSDIFPFFDSHIEFSKGSTDIRQLYTVEINGDLEFPIYVTQNQDEEPTDKVLTDGIQTVINEGRSEYDRNKALLFDNVNDAFTKNAAGKFSRNDINRVEDPKEFYGSFVKDALWLMQQYGKELSDRGKIVKIGNHDFKVKAYGEPSKWDRWKYWAVGDMVYDFIDAGFDPVQFRLPKLAPISAQQIIKEEYKVIAALRRSMFTARPSKLCLNINDLSISHEKRIREHLERYQIRIEHEETEEEKKAA